MTSSPFFRTAVFVDDRHWQSAPNIWMRWASMNGTMLDRIYERLPNAFNWIFAF